MLSNGLNGEALNSADGNVHQAFTNLNTLHDWLCSQFYCVRKLEQARDNYENFRQRSQEAVGVAHYRYVQLRNAHTQAVAFTIEFRFFINGLYPSINLQQMIMTFIGTREFPKTFASVKKTVDEVKSATISSGGLNLKYTCQNQTNNVSRNGRRGRGRGRCHNRSNNTNNSNNRNNNYNTRFIYNNARYNNTTRHNNRGRNSHFHGRCRGRRRCNNNTRHPKNRNNNNNDNNTTNRYPNGTRRCYICNKFGHIAANCRYNNNNNDNNNNNSNTQSTNPNKLDVDDNFIRTTSNPPSTNTARAGSPPTILHPYYCNCAHCTHPSECTCTTCTDSEYNAYTVNQLTHYDPYD